MLLPYQGIVFHEITERLTREEIKRKKAVTVDGEIIMDDSLKIVGISFLIVIRGTGIQIPIWSCVKSIQIIFWTAELF